jgi:dCMP deaminase
MLKRIAIEPDRFDHFFLSIAEDTAQLSKDSTKVGAVIVKDRRILSNGYNGFPRGVNDDVAGRKERPAKYLYTVHAEINAILNASRTGVSVEGATLYLNYSPESICAGCTAALIQAGIADVRGSKYRTFPNPSVWNDSFIAAEEMSEEVGMVRYLFI